MSFKQFKHLNVPDSWERYFTKYPQGMTILESLFEWVSQVNEMSELQNELTTDVEKFQVDLDLFTSQFGDNLAGEINKMLNEWLDSGFLNVVLTQAMVDQIALINTELLKFESSKLTRNENESVTMNMLAADIKQAISDGTWEFSLNTEDIANGAITRNKISFYEPNYTNMAGTMDDGLYYDIDGTRVDDTTMGTTAILDVQGGQVYKIFNTNLDGNRKAYVHFWRESMSKNGGFLADGVFTVPENSAFMRVGVGLPTDDFVLIRDSDNYSFNDPLLELKKPNQVGHNVVEPESTTFITKEPKNIFNLTDFVPDYTYTLSGTISTTQNLGYIEFPVKPGESFKMEFVGFAQTAVSNSYITFWSDYGFVSSVQAQDFTVPANSEINTVRVAVSPDYKGYPQIIKVGDEFKYTDNSSSIPATNVIDLPKNKILVSIVGDSIGTYNYGMKKGNRSYYPKGDVNAINKTWWQKMIDRKIWLELLVNNSWSGSSSSNSGTGNGTPHTDGVNAIKYVGIGETKPDIIIYQKITNDFGNNVPLEKFESDYKLMIANSKQYNPNSTLFICTGLYRTQQTNELGHTLEDYNSIVRSIGSEYGIQVIDFYTCGVNASNASTHLIDGIHPTSSGMHLMFLRAKEVIDSYI